MGIVLVSLVGLVLAGNFEDKIQSDFLGTFNNTFYNSSGFIQLNNSINGTTIVNTTNVSEMTGSETGLVSYWRFNETSWNGINGEVKDVLGKNNGTAKTNANISLGLFGNSGNFSGTSGAYVNEVQIANKEELNPGTGSFTITGWAKSITRGGNGYQLYVAKRDNVAGGKNGYYIGILEGSGIKFVVGDGTNRVDTSYVDIDYTKWFHFAAVINRTSNQSLLYINGSLATSSSIATVGKINNSWNLSMGNDEGQALLGATWQYPVKGQIDEVAIWNKALSLSEVLELYNKGITNVTSSTINSSEFYNGTYESNVKDAGAIVQWNNISWSEDIPYGDEISFNNLNLSGLVGLWHLNEQSGNIIDSNGKNNGSYNGALYSQSGKFNSSIGFDGTNDYVNLGNSNSVRITGNITISSWVKFNQIPSDSTVYSLVDKNEAGGYGIIANEASSGKLETYFYIGGYKNAGIALSSLSAGTWYHIIGRYNGTGVDFYLNGVKQQSVATTGSISDISYNLTLGANPGPTYAEFFNGNLDEVGIWNRSLSDSEILNLYKRGILSLKFQVRAGNTNPITSDYLGPDGTSSSYFDNNQNINLDSRYIQYKSFFSRESLEDNLRLYNVTINYDSSANSNVSVSLDSPSDNYLTDEYNINVTCSASSLAELSNVSVYYDKFGWAPLETKTISGTSNTTSFILGEIVNSVKWNCYFCDIDGICSFANSNRTIIGDIASPTISLVSPENNYSENSSSSVNFIFNATDNRATSLNCSLFLNGVYAANNNSVPNGQNGAISYSLSNGDYNWKINCSDGLNSAESSDRNLIVNVSSAYTPFWAKSNTHTHTTNSDGDSSPAIVAGLYRNKGYNIVAITDHGYVTNCTSLTNLSANFLCISSEEWTSTKHVVRINVNSTYNNAAVNIQNAVNAANDAGGFAIAAHPNWSSTIWSVSDLINLQNYTAMEIYNKVIERLSPDPYAVQKWDSVLISGKKVFGVAADDMHQVNVDLGYGFTKAYMPEFTISAYVNSMKTGYFYSSQGPSMDLGPFSLDCDGFTDYHMGETANCSAISVSTIISATNSSFVVSNISLIKDGNVINLTVCSSQNCSFSYSENVSSSGYYRLEAVDSNNRKIWSNPIWINKIALPVIIIVNSPENNSEINDYTPTLNVNLNQNTSLWYKVNNGENISLCSNCNAYIGSILLREGLNNVSVYANNSDNAIREDKVFITLNFNKNISESFEDNSSIQSTSNLVWNNGKISMNSSNIAGNFVLKPIFTTNNITEFSIKWTENNTENAKGDGQRTPIILKYRFGNSSWISTDSYGEYIVNGTTISGLNGNNLSLMFDFEKNPEIPIDLLNFELTWKEFTVPNIFNVSSGTPTIDSATISWDTDLDSNSTVFYGMSTSLGSSYNKAEIVNSHSIILTSLTPGTSYFYKVQSCTDASCSQDPQTGLYSFITQSSTPSTPGGSGGSSGGGGGSGSVNVSKIGLLEVSKLGEVIAYSGDKKTLSVSVKNKGAVFANNCKLTGKGDLASWIYSTQKQGIAKGEIVDFVFDLNVPQEINSGYYIGEIEISCDEAKDTQKISVNIPGLNFIEVGELVYENNKLNVNYHFDSSKVVGEGASVDIWVTDENGNELNRVQDLFAIDGSIINRNVVIDLDRNLAGIYYVYFALSDDADNFIKQSVVLGEGRTTGFFIWGATNGKMIGYIIFLIIILVGVFLIFRNHKDKLDSHNTHKWLLRKKGQSKFR